MKRFLPFILGLLLCFPCISEELNVTEKQAVINGVQFNYAESEDNGPALVMLHAQLLDWYTYHLVIPELGKYFHIYAIDYSGHGKTVTPEGYDFTAERIGEDLSCFIKEVIGEKVYITGNSSGGLLTTWICANHPELVIAAVLEDPPLFSAEYPEIKKTIAYRSFTTSHTALTEGYDDDFLMYWVNQSKKFFKTYTKPGTQWMLKIMIRSFRKHHPNETVYFANLPVSVAEMIRGLDMYNPKFGNAFYEGTWNQNFSHEEALSKIDCPVLLIQADYSYTEDGILNGAMSKEMADNAVGLLKNGSYVKMDCGHVTNLEAPEEFSAILEDFFLNKNEQD